MPYARFHIPGLEAHSAWFKRNDVHSSSPRHLRPRSRKSRQSEAPCRRSVAKRIPDCRAAHNGTPANFVETVHTAAAEVRSRRSNRNRAVRQQRRLLALPRGDSPGAVRYRRANVARDSSPFRVSATRASDSAICCGDLAAGDRPLPSPVRVNGHHPQYPQSRACRFAFVHVVSGSRQQGVLDFFPDVCG